MEEKMTRRSWMRSSLTTLASLAAASSLPIHLKGNIVPAVIPLKGGTNQNRSKVLMTKEISPDALVKIYEALKRKASGRVAIKISTGEPGGHNFLQPSLIKDLVQKVSGTIVECNTAYVGKRFTTEEHIQAVKDHGFFDIAKVDIMDSEGEFNIPVKDKNISNITSSEPI